MFRTGDSHSRAVGDSVMAVLVLGGVVLAIAIVYLISFLNRPADRNHVSEQWLVDHIRGRRE